MELGAGVAKKFSKFLSNSAPQNKFTHSSPRLVVSPSAHCLDVPQFTISLDSLLFQCGKSEII